MKKLSKKEQKKVMGGYSQPPGNGHCSGNGVVCPNDAIGAQGSCCDGMICVANAGGVKYCPATA